MKFAESKTSRNTIIKAKWKGEKKGENTKGDERTGKENREGPERGNLQDRC